jgi:ligand-binding sensor domain-containing protein
MRAKTKTYSFTILFLFFCQIVFGQQLLFENYTSEKGLSQNSCYAIEQDSYGFMWFGTQDGLNRYDGKQFLAYSQQNAMGRNLPSNIITSLFYDTRKDLLWVGTAQGACIYNLHGDSLMKISSFLPLAIMVSFV